MPAEPSAEPTSNLVPVDASSASSLAAQESGTEGGFAQRAFDRVHAPLGGHKPNQATTESAIFWIVRLKRVVRWARNILLFVLILCGMYLWLRFELYSLPAGYDVMEPSYRAEDTVLVDRVYEYFPSFVANLQQGDVVLFVDAMADGTRREALARIYALPGQRIDVVEHAPDDWRFAIDHDVLPSYGPRPYAPSGRLLNSNLGVVPAEHFFVLIDNATADAVAYDSRHFTGTFLPFDNVRGKIALGWGTTDARPPLPVEAP